MPDTSSPPTWTVRRARAADAEAVTAIWLQMAREHEQFDPVAWSWSDDPGPVWRGWFVSCTMNPEFIALVAVDRDDRPAGYVLARAVDMPAIMRMRRKGEILDIAMAPLARGQGGGNLLMAAALDRLRKRGAEGVSLTVAAANASAIAFYERLGLRIGCHVMVGDMGGGREISSGSHTEE